MDVLTTEQRRHNMSRIRGKHTKPEMQLRRALHAAGMRFRLHAASLPGRPDIVLPRHRAVILIHGCFWHGHECPLFRIPKTRRDFWTNKIQSNRQRDQRSAKALQQTGWRVLIVWECTLKGPGRRSLAEIVDSCVAFIRGQAQQAELAGIWSE
jgi:DNA mismatch endonuclease (patch repair protein)